MGGTVTRRYTSAQLRSMLRQIEQKQKQAIDKYNQAIRQHNAGVRRAVNDYNREARAHNARVLRNRQQLQSAIRRLQSGGSRLASYVTFGRSVETVHTSYTRLEAAVASTELDPRTEYLIDLSEREAANSVGLAESLAGEESTSSSLDILDHADISDELIQISSDLENRWRGAVFALNPGNPDAARHFCTSAREIFVKILDLKAPDDQVLRANPEAARTQEGRVTRRARLSYLLQRQGVRIEELEHFADSDIENVMELFRLFNDGTHGPAGTFSFQQLQMVRRRVENALQFLSQLARFN